MQTNKTIETRKSKIIEKQN